MKKTLTLLVTVLMLFSTMSMLASAAPATYNAPLAAAPELDGVVSDGEWDAAPEVELEVVTTPGVALVYNPTMKLMHDGTNLYALVQATTSDMKNDNVFVCVHVPHDGCTLNGCKSYIKFVIDGANTTAWGYWEDSNFDGVNDLGEGDFTKLVKAAYGLDEDHTLSAEIQISANYGEALPTDAPIHFDLRFDEENVWSTHQWQNQQRTWDATFNPETDAGLVYCMAEGADTPAVTEPAETEPVNTEAVETESAETEPTETEPEETGNEAKDTGVNDGKKEPTEEKSFPIVPVIAVAAIIVLACILFFIFRKRK